MSVAESRSFQFPKSRSKYLTDAVKIAKTLPGFEKSKNHYKVTFGKSDSGSDDLWELLKIAGHWKGSLFLIDGKEVEQAVWEESFRGAPVEPAVAPKPAEEPVAKAEPVAEGTAPEVEEKPEPTPAKAEEKRPEPEEEEKAPESVAEPEPVDAENALEPGAEAEEPKVEEKPGPAPEKKAEEKKPEPAPEEKAEEKKPEPVPEKKPEDPKAEEKPAAKPVTVHINPAPKPQDNSGCGKSAAVFLIAALGLLKYFLR